MSKRSGVDVENERAEWMWTISDETRHSVEHGTRALTALD